MKGQKHDEKEIEDAVSKFQNIDKVIKEEFNKLYSYSAERMNLREQQLLLNGLYN